MGAVRRIRPYGFVNQPGNGLDDFEPETGAEPATPAVHLDSLPADASALAADFVHPAVPISPAPRPLLAIHLDSLLEDVPPPAADVIHPNAPDQSTAASALMEMVVAYPELELYPTDLSSLRSATGRQSPGRRHVVSSALRAARAVAFVPVLILGWFMLRLGWLARRSVHGAWRLVAGTVGLVWAGLRAGGHGAVARVPLVGRNMVAAAAAGVAFAQAAAIGIRNRLVRTVHAIAARLGPAVEATVARVPLVRRNMVAAAAAGVAFAQAAALGIRNRLVRTVHAIAARLGPAVEATVARVPLVRRNMVAAAAAGVAFAQAAALGIRNRLVRTVHAIAARLGPGVEATVARVPLVRRNMAAAAAAGVAFARAVVLGIRDRARGHRSRGRRRARRRCPDRGRARHLGPQEPGRAGCGDRRLRAGRCTRHPEPSRAHRSRDRRQARRRRRGVVARVTAGPQRHGRGGRGGASATEPAAAIGIPNAASRTPQALAPGLGTAVHAAIARIGIVGVTAVDKARRGTASAMAFLRTSSAPAKAAAVSFARIRDVRHPARRASASRLSRDSRSPWPCEPRGASARTWR